MRGWAFVSLRGRVCECAMQVRARVECACCVVVRVVVVRQARVWVGWRCQPEAMLSPALNASASSVSIAVTAAAMKSAVATVAAAAFAAW